MRGPRLPMSYRQPYGRLAGYGFLDTRSASRPTAMAPFLDPAPVRRTRNDRS